MNALPEFNEPFDSLDDAPSLTYVQLEKRVKERLRDDWRQYAMNYDWWDCVYDDAITIGRLMGIQIDDITFSGFWSQGDGARFKGYWRSPADPYSALCAVIDHAPLDKNLHEIAFHLLWHAWTARNFVSLNADIAYSGHMYEHENMTDIGIEAITPDEMDDWNEFQCLCFDAVNRGNGFDLQRAETDVPEALRDYMKWIYRQLEAEYDAMTTDEYIDEDYSNRDERYDEEGNQL